MPISTSRAAILTLLLAASPAWADPGDHIKIAGGQLVPSVSLMTTWRSNNYLTPGAAFSGEDRYRTIAGFNLQVAPSLLLKTRSRYLNVDASAVYEARKFIGDELSNLDRFKNVNLGLNTVILPEAIVGAKVGTSFRITGRETEAVSSDDAYLQQTISRTQASVTVRPGSSMEIDLGGSFDIKDINTPQPLDGTQQFSLNSSTGYGFLGTFNWKFFPKTALVASVERSVFSWENNQNVLYESTADFDADRFPGVMPFVIEQNGQGVLFVPDGKLLHVDGGIRGRFTERLIVGAVLGFSRIIYDDKLDGSFAVEDRATGCAVPERGTTDAVADDLVGFPCTLTGNIELGYDVAKDQRITVGFLRDHQDVFFTNYVTMNRSYASYSGRIGKRLMPTVGFEANQQLYRGQVQRTDLWLRTRADVSWRALPWMDLTGGTWFTGRRSVGGEFAEVEYDDVNVHLGAVFSY